MSKTGGTVGTNGHAVRGVSVARRQSAAVVDRLAANHDDMDNEPHCIERPDGARVWYLRGRTHNDHGPAIESPDGGRWWYRHGVRHRVDGPAVEFPNGGVEWWFEGRPHNDHGPAIEYADGTREWWVHGHQVQPPASS